MCVLRPPGYGVVLLVDPARSLSGLLDIVRTSVTVNNLTDPAIQPHVIF